MARREARPWAERERVLRPARRCCPGCGRRMPIRYENRRTVATLQGPVRRAMVNVGVRVSGGDLLLGSLHGLTVAEADALDHLGQALRVVQPAPAARGGLAELVDHRQGRLP